MARKAMSIIDVMAWVRGASRIKGSRLSNAYEVGGIIYLKFKGSRWSGILAAEPGVRLHETSRFPGAPSRVTPFAAVLRKHVRGQKVEEVEQVGRDRIAAIRFAKGHKLVVEMVPRGVIALISPEGRIIAATKYVELRDRTIKPRREYVPPPSRQKWIQEMEIDEIKDAISAHRDLIRGIVRGLGLPGEAAEEAIYRAGLSGDVDPSSLGMNDLETLREAVVSIINESMEARGYLVRTEDVLEATPFKPTRFSEEDVIEYSLIDQALDELFAALTRMRGEEDEESDRKSVV